MPQPIKLLVLGGLSLSLLVGNAALAQSNDDFVVPTGGNSSTLPTGTTNPSTGSTVQTAERFTCQFHNGQYTVMYQPRSQPGQFFPWATPRALGGGWDAQRRCLTIAQRLELYRPDGLLELQTAVENRHNILCVTTEANPSCRIVLTVPPDRDPFIVRNSVFENLVTADSGQQTFGVNTYTNRGNQVENIYNMGRSILGGRRPQASNSRTAINLKPYLAREDGGTATGLRNAVRLQPNQTRPQSATKLKPGNFR